MYLKAEKYLGNYNHTDNQNRKNRPPMNTPANNVFRRFPMINRASALGKLIAFALRRPVEFRAVPDEAARTRRKNQSAKLSKKFRELVADAVVFGVTDEHFQSATAPTLHDSKQSACEILERAIAAAKRAHWQPVEDRRYTLAELRSLCAQSGSRFFKDIAKKNCYVIERNVVVVRSRKDGVTRYRFNPEQGDFELAPVARIGDFTERVEVEKVTT